MTEKTPSPSDVELVAKLIKFPADWVSRIDKARGDESFSDFVRTAVLEKIDRRGLSEMPAWGQGRPAKPKKKATRRRRDER